MKFSVARNQIEKIFAQRNGYMVLSFSALLICFLQTILIFMLIGRERVIVIPPSISKSFWVSSQSVSAEYLSEMTTFFATLRLNITSENAESQREQILQYTDPAYYGSLKTKLVEEADKLKEQGLSIAFFPISVKVSQKKLQTKIEGDLKSFIGTTALPTQRVTYLVTYNYDQGRLLIKSFEELQHA